MKLYLDTSDNLKTVIRLDEQELVTQYQSPRDQDVIGALLQAVRNRGSSIQDITEIEVCEGPGSFTGLRVGASVASALGWALQVPVNGKPVGQVVVPDYGKDPNISQPKKS